MPLNYNQLQVLVGVFATVDIGLAIFGLRAIKRLRQQRAQFEHLWKMTHYLAHLIDENNIQLSEFDIIALRELGLVEIEEQNA